MKNLNSEKENIIKILVDKISKTNFDDCLNSDTKDLIEKDMKVVKNMR